MKFCILFIDSKICLLLLLVFSGITTSVGEPETTPEPKDCKWVTIECICEGHNETKVDKYHTFLMKINGTKDKDSEGMVNCTSYLSYIHGIPADKHYYTNPYKACASINCVLKTNETSGTGDKGAISSFHPKEFTMLRGDVIRGRRFAKDNGFCRVTSLKNAEVKCWKYPHSVTCNIKCVYGYGLRTRDGTLTSSVIRCTHDEDRWEPHGFYDCLPYLNCKVQLKSPGSVKCQENINRPAYCDIACADYEDYEGAPLQRYECVDDSFGENFPYCVGLRNHGILIQKP